MSDRPTKGSLIGVGVSLVIGVGLVVLLLWMARDDVTGNRAPIARAADPIRFTVGMATSTASPWKVEVPTRSGAATPRFCQ